MRGKPADDWITARTRHDRALTVRSSLPKPTTPINFDLHKQNQKRERMINGTARNRSAARRAIRFTALGFALSAGVPVLAHAAGTDWMVDRVQIQDLFTRYYYNFGKAGGDVSRFSDRE